MNHPYFDQMRFQVNNSSVDITPPPTFRGSFNPETSLEYRNCQALAEEIRKALTQVREDVRERIQQAAVQCPCCGATTTPDERGCCEYCGGALND